MDVKVNVPHLHPIFVHFPQALFPVAFAALCLYLLTGVREFETGAFVAALFGALAAPVTTATGFFDWWNRYQAYMTSVFKIKITGSFVLMALGGAGGAAARVPPGPRRSAAGRVGVGVLRAPRGLHRHVRRPGPLRGETRFPLSAYQGNAGIEYRQRGESS